MKGPNEDCNDEDLIRRLYQTLIMQGPRHGSPSSLVQIKLVAKGPEIYFKSLICWEFSSDDLLPVERIRNVLAALIFLI